MLVREVMTPDVTMIRPNDTLQEAADKMRFYNLGPLPVCDRDRIVGILTDRDITVRATADGLSPWRDRVRDVMTTDVLYCFDDQDVDEAERIMDREEVRRLIVVDHDRRLVGIVSRRDIPAAGPTPH